LHIVRLSISQRSDAELDLIACCRGKELSLGVEERLHFCIRLGYAHPGPESCKDPHWIAETTIGSLLSSRVQGHGEDDVRRFQRRELKLFRHDPDNAGGVAVDIDHLIQDVRIPIVVPLPEPVGDHHDAGTIGTVFFRQKVSAQDRGDPKQGEKSRLERNAVQLLRIILDEVAIVDACTLACESRKRPLIVLPFYIEASHEELLVLQRMHQAQRDDSTRISIR